MTRPVITRSVAHMETPDTDTRAQAARHGGDAAYNAYLQDTLPALTTIELQQPPAPLTPQQSLTIAAWNIERCKRVEDSATLIRRAGADIVLATEVDYGMARSGQRHTTRDLAQALGMGYIYGTEFVELGTGDPYETSLFETVPNEHGLHGNAILSRFPLKNVSLIPLDAGGLWFVTQPNNDGQLRIGGRMGMAAQIETESGDLTLVSVHYESESDPKQRAQQTGTLLAGLTATYGDGPAIIGGDLNTNTLLDGETTGSEALASPANEPAFDTYSQAGFDWRLANSGQPTTRAAPGKPVRYPLQILDWLLIRGVASQNPKVWPAVSDAGHYLSDHEMISIEIKL